LKKLTDITVEEVQNTIQNIEATQQNRKSSQNFFVTVLKSAQN
jgi:hypothetical protein